MAPRDADNKSFPGTSNILIRGTNWIGDAVMTLPAVAAIRSSHPQARISVLVKPWVADIYRLCPQVDEVLLYEAPGRHAGWRGIFRLAGELRQRRFDMAILLQNAIEAAIIARLAGIPLRLGYNTDARGFLLTQAVKLTPARKKIHQADYYLKMVQELGCTAPGQAPFFRLTAAEASLADDELSRQGLPAPQLLIGMAPGATYGPAKKWFPERFGALAKRLGEGYGATTILFGSAADRETTAAVRRSSGLPLVDLAGKTGLRSAVALVARCRLFISNDSGLMHVAGALNIPTIAIFGSTNPTTTSPLGERSTVISRYMSCSPCLKTTCPTDFRCMDAITVDAVYEIARGMLCDG